MKREEFLNSCTSDIFEGDEPELDFNGTVLEKRFKKFTLEYGINLRREDIIGAKAASITPILIERTPKEKTDDVYKYV